MSGFGSNPTTGTQGALSANQFPLSSVAEPGRANGDLTALEGGPGSVDGNSNRTAPVSMYVKDGGDVTQGTSTDANTANTIMGRLTKIRDLLNATITVGGTITEANSASIKADLDTINTAIGAVSDVAWSGSGNGSEIALLKKIVAELAATLTVSGTVTANAGTGTFTNQQSNITADYDSGAGTQNLTMFGVALPASGGAVSGGTSTNPIRTDPTGTTTQPVNGTVTVQQSTASSLKVDLSGTAANSTAIKVDGSGVTQPVSGTVTANIGTTNGVALDTSVNGVIVAQGSTTSGEKGPLIQGAVTTSAPTYTTAQTSPISLTTTGAVRVDNSAVTQPVSGTITANAGTGSFTVAQATGSNLHTVIDAGSAVIGHVINDASSAVIGHVIADSGSTTAVTQATASNLNAQVVGSVASGASNAGNPVKDGGVFNTTQPTVTNGQVVDAQYSARGAAIVATGVDSFAVNASQTGTWNVTNVSGTVSLPTGASTSAKQPALGTAGSASSDVLTVQGIASMTALKVDGSGVTQPVSGTVTANAGTGTFTNQQSNITTDYDTGAGTQTMTMFGLALPASGGSVAGGTSTNPVQVSLANTAANSTAVKVDGSAVTQPVSGTVSITANSAVNVAQINGVTTTMGNGISGTGVQRVTLASDSTGQVTLATGANTIGALTANQSVNVAQIAGSTTSTAATGVQKVGIVGNGGATVDSTIGAGTAPTNAVVTGSVYNSSAPAPTSGQAMALQADQAGNSRIFPGIALAALSAWNSVTSLNATQNIFTNSGAEAVLVQLTQTTTLSAGAVTFEVTYDGSNWSTIPASAVLDPTSTTFAQISLPYTVQASTNKTFLLNMNGAQGLRVKLSTQITGTGSVTPNYALLPASPADTVIALSPTAANFNVTVGGSLPVGSNTVGAVTQASGPWTQNVTQFGGSNVATGTGASGTGIPRITVANDSQVQVWDGTNKTNVLAATSASNAVGSQAAQLTAGAYSEQASLSAGSLNADLVPSTDVSNYKWASLQIKGTWSGTLTFQMSNDNSTWLGVLPFDLAGGAFQGSAIGYNSIFTFAVQFRYLRIRMTSYASGTANGVLELYTSPAASTSYTYSVIANAAPWLIAGPSSNATQAANTAGNVVVKGSAGYLWTATVTTTGTAALSIYDNASTNSGTPLLVIPASAAVGSIYTFNGGQRANNGIVSAGVTNCPAVTFSYS